VTLHFPLHKNDNTQYKQDYQYKSNTLNMEPDIIQSWDRSECIYRMCVAGRDSNCRDRNSSLCLSWCFCGSEVEGCLDSSSKSPKTHTNMSVMQITSIRSDVSQLPFRTHTHRPNLKFTHHIRLLVMVAINFTLIQKQVNWISFMRSVDL